MKTIKVIDLLNKIANGEEVPKRIKYKDEIRDYSDGDKDYCCSGSKNYFLFFDVLHKGTGAKFKKALNDEVEIIEEKKIPEKLEKYYYYLDDGSNSDNYFENILKLSGNGASEITEAESFMIDKINEIIDYLESKEKGE